MKPAVTAALITGAQTLEFRTFEQPPPPPDCVTVDIRLCGICGTEIASFRSGHLHSPAVCGHEWVGTIAAVGDGVSGLAPGDRVVAGISVACGRCPECLRGLPDSCRTASLVARGRSPLAPPHGGFARSITVEQGRVVPVASGLSDEQAAQVEPATVALHGVRRSRIAPGDVVVVQGAGPIGLFALQFARAAGAGDVVAIEPAEARRRLASVLGASIAVAPQDAKEAVDTATPGLARTLSSNAPVCRSCCSPQPI